MPEGLSSFLRDNFVDLIIVVTIAAAIYRGYRRGFIKEFLGFAGLFVGVILGVRYMSDLSSLLMTFNLESQTTTIISFLVIFLTVMFFFRWLAQKFKILSKLSFTLGGIDRLVGMGFGLIKGALLVSIVTVLLRISGISFILSEPFSKSQLYKPMQQVLPLAYSFSKVFIIGNYKKFSKELQESLNLDKQAFPDQNLNDLIHDFQ